MYLLQSAANKPTFIACTSEPPLLKWWANEFPGVAMCHVYGLSRDALGIWKDHLHNNIVNEIRVTSRIIDNNQRLFDTWIASGENPELFKTEPISKIALLAGYLRTSCLLEDFFCLECNADEPAFIYMNTSHRFTGHNAWIMSRFEKPLFNYPDYYNIETQGCHVCNPSEYPLIDVHRVYARRKMDACRCVPCRRSL